jgi:UDP-N-acetylglucosamine transferase subunit ALG13
VGTALTIQTYQYKPSLRPDVDAADLVISHAGAGSILEALRTVVLLSSFFSDLSDRSNLSNFAQY